MPGMPGMLGPQVHLLPGYRVCLVTWCLARRYVYLEYTLHARFVCLGTPGACDGGSSCRVARSAARLMFGEGSVACLAGPGGLAWWLGLVCLVAGTPWYACRAVSLIVGGHSLFFAPAQHQIFELAGNAISKYDSQSCWHTWYAWNACYLLPGVAW